MTLEALVLLSLIPGGLLGFIGGVVFSYYKQKKQVDVPMLSKAIDHGMTGLVIGLIWPLSIAFAVVSIPVVGTMYGLQWLVWKTGVFSDD